MNNSQNAQTASPLPSLAVLPLPEAELSDYQYFTETLSAYRYLIDARISDYARQKVLATTEMYGADSAQAYQSFLAILSRGGKRLRGSLTMAAYYMFGGQDQTVALQAALVIEMVQAYLLVIDDICDRSDLRRGGPTAHRLVATIHQQANWQDDPEHFGQSIAMIGAMLGLHQALAEIDDIAVDQTAKLAAIKNLNDCLSVTAHGQFNDIYAQVKQTTDIQAIKNILVWKTAYYTFINPLQFGALLAEASLLDSQLLTKFSLYAGQAFQLTDDLMGVFGIDQQTGKSSLDDIKEGKRTLLITLALQQAGLSEIDFLASMLGNKELTQSQLSKCQQIIKNTPAYSQVQAEIKQSLQVARHSLCSLELQKVIDGGGQKFLAGMLRYLEGRQV